MPAPTGLLVNPRAEAGNAIIALVEEPTRPIAVAGRNGEGPVHWAPISGRWKFDATSARYLSGAPWGAFGARNVYGGLALSNLSMQDGKVSVKVTFEKFDPDVIQSAGVVFGYTSAADRYVYAQLGASGSAYAIGEFDPGFGWRPQLLAGDVSNLEAGTEYALDVVVLGQRIRFLVDGVRIFEHLDPTPPVAGQVGLIAAGESEIVFTDFSVVAEQPRMFVAMQFSEPFNTLYREVIRPEAEKLGFRVVRLDELAGPGIIFEDIKRQIAESKLVIAEITAPNQNVFYELGYAHALNKPTILLAQRGKELPFDIRSYRVIFYDDTIGGKPELERSLREHLRAVLQGA